MQDFLKNCQQGIDLLNEDISEEEIKIGINGLKSGKAPGPDGNTRGNTIK